MSNLKICETYEPQEINCSADKGTGEGGQLELPMDFPRILPSGIRESAIEGLSSKLQEQIAQAGTRRDVLGLLDGHTPVSDEERRQIEKLRISVEKDI